jgi:6-phosphofructokinase 2
MKPIVTVTLNPSVDADSETEKVQHTHKIRTSNEIFDPGGGGINVARMIAELGGPATAIYLAGGPIGTVFDTLVEARGIPARRIDIADTTRISHTVRERSTGQEYRFVPEGPELKADECQRLTEALDETDCDYLVASGSLPRGVPRDFYARLAQRARARQVRFVLDTSGESLRVAVETGGLFLAKPSFGEFEALVGRKLPEPAAQHEAALSLVRAGKVELLAVTLGHHGAFLAHRDGILRLPALDVKPVSAVGAGDSFVGAMILGLAQGRARDEAFRFGMAAGTAAVITPGAELAKRAEVERLFEQFRALEGV